jgi:hypothetical protein
MGGLSSRAIGRGQRAGELLRPGIPGSRTDLEYFKRMPKIQLASKLRFSGKQLARSECNLQSLSKPATLY